MGEIWGFGVYLGGERLGPRGGLGQVGLLAALHGLGLGFRG